MSGEANFTVVDGDNLGFKTFVSFGNVDLSGIENLDDYEIDCDIDAGIAQVGGHSKGVAYSSDGNGAGSIEVHVDAGNIDIN